MCVKKKKKLQYHEFILNFSTSLNCLSLPDQQGAPLLLSDSTALTPDDLLGFSFQVSQAMDFLSSRNVSALPNHLSPLPGDVRCVLWCAAHAMPCVLQCVHRDLAARNVLVCDGKLAKVCDFGLSRDVLKHQDYVARGNVSSPLQGDILRNSRGSDKRFHRANFYFEMTRASCR